MAVDIKSLLDKTHFPAGIKKPVTRTGSSNGSLTVCYSHMGKPHTTIAANTFHF